VCALKAQFKCVRARARLQGRVARIWRRLQQLEGAQAPDAQLPIMTGRGQPAVPDQRQRGDARAVLCRMTCGWLRASHGHAKAQTIACRLMACRPGRPPSLCRAWSDVVFLCTNRFAAAALVDQLHTQDHVW